MFASRSVTPRSIPIVSKLDYTNPPPLDDHSCGVGGIAWNTVESSPFAQETFVNSWEELPERLYELRQKSDEYINKLQVNLLTGEFTCVCVHHVNCFR